MRDEPRHSQLISGAPPGRVAQVDGEDPRAPLDPRPLAAGDELLGGRFVLSRLLGAGGMGVVFEAEDRRDDDVVALKTLRALNPEGLLRFKKEFRSLQDIHHPHLASLGELFEDEGRWFFTMELVRGINFIEHVRGEAPPGGSTTIDPTQSPLAPSTWDGLPLAATIAAGPSRQEKTLPVDEPLLRRALWQLTEGLAAIHAAGKVHRDIKPSNVLVERESQRVVVLDFGLVTDVTEGDPALGSTLAGTLLYMAPEQATGDAVGPAADLFSVGVMLYQALCGKLPFSGPPAELTQLKRRAILAPPRAHCSSVPEDLEQLCLALLRPCAEKRPDGPTILRQLESGPIELAARAEPVPTGPTAARAVPFVGRERELSRLLAALRQARSGAAVTAWLSGESGMGKTALLRRFRDRVAVERDSPVFLSGRCHERESVPYKALDGLVDSLCDYLQTLSDVDLQRLLPTDAGLLRRAFPVLGRISAFAMAPLSHAGAPAELRSRIVSALHALLDRLARRQTLVLCIDDVQWADSDSAALLREIMRPSRAPPLLLLLSAQSGAAQEAGASHDGSSGSEPERLVREAGSLSPECFADTQRIVLGPLGQAAAFDLAAALMGSNSAQAARVAGEASGHPLYIAELARHLTTHHQQSVPGLAEAICARYEQLPQGAQAVAVLTALAVCPLPQSVIARAAGLGAGEVFRRIALLRSEHFVRRSGEPEDPLVECYHDRARNALVEHLGADIREAYHARLATALEDSSVAADRPDILLWHLAAAAQPARAARYAEQAARRASTALAFDRAAELFRAALRLGQHDPAVARGLQLELATALSNAGRGLDAAESFLGGAVGATPAEALQCRCRAAEQLLIAGHLERGVALSEEILTELGTPLPTTTAGTLKALLWARARLRVGGLRQREGRGRATETRLAELEALCAVARGLGMVDTLRGALCQTRALLLALQIGDARGVGRALAYEAALLASQGARNRARALRVRDAAARIAEETADPHLRTWVAATDACLCYFAGRYGEAERLLAEAERDFGQQVGTTFELNATRSLWLNVVRESGDLKRLNTLCERYLEDAQRRGDRYADTTVRQLGHLRWLAADDPARALDDLARATWVPPGETFHLQHWYGLRARGDVALYRRRAAEEIEPLLEEIGRLRRSALVRVERVQSAGLWLEGRLLLATLGTAAQRSGSRVRIGHIARRLDRQDTPHAQIYADLLRAGLAAQLGHDQRVDQALERASSLADRCGCQLYAAAARYCRGLRLGPDGAGLVGAARAWMEGQGIRRPRAMAELILPGLPVDEISS